MKKILLYLSLAVVVLGTSCRGNESDSDVVTVNAEVEDLWTLFPRYATLPYDEQICIIDSLRPSLTAMMQVVTGDAYAVPNPEMLTQWSASPAVEFFTPAVDSVYGGKNTVAYALSAVLSKADERSLALPRLRYATTVWGKTTPIIFNDTVMLVALNHYLGADYPAYESAPEYMRRLKTPENLPYDLTEAVIAHAYPFEDGSDGSMVNRLLYEGALVYAKIQLAPGKLNIAAALGIDPNQLKWLSDNETNIWHTLAAKKLLFSSNPSDIGRLFDPAPSTPLIHSDAPGRVGRYVGYKIVESYVKNHPDVTLSFLLSKDFYGNRQSLVEAGYAANS